jgi:acyl carrier protein
MRAGWHDEKTAIMDLMADDGEPQTVITEIKEILGDVLGLGQRAQEFSRDTALLGALPEFDSMAVVSVLTAIEEQFGIIIEDDDVDASVFETIGALADFVDNKVSA